jgi:DNA-directed RNA polymerase specialized sigma subunit
MKAEQEQTKQMLKTLCDKFQCSAIDRSYMAKSCRQCEDIIEALHEAGYGDISEYKAEIESLKNANIELVDNLVFYKDKSYKLEKNVDKLKTEIRQEVKQAQIEILGKLKERIKTAIDTYFNLDGGGYYLAEGAIDDIDGLIEEVEK